MPSVNNETRPSSNATVQCGAEAEALANFQEADEQRQLAQQNEAKAVHNADLAEERRQEADTQRNAAVDARQLADQRRPKPIGNAVSPSKRDRRKSMPRTSHGSV